METSSVGLAAFGVALRAARNAAGLTQDQLGALSNISRRTIVRWESGQVSPWVPELTAALDALGLEGPQRQDLVALLDTHRSRTVQSPESDVEIGAYLRIARTRAGLTTYRLADQMGCHQTTVVRWESGALRPSNVDLEKLGTVLAINPLEIQELSSKPSIPPSSNAEFEEDLRGLMWPWDPNGYICFDARFANLFRRIDEAGKPRWKTRSRVSYAWMLSTCGRHAEAQEQAKEALDLPESDLSDRLLATLLLARCHSRANNRRRLPQALKLLDSLQGRPLNWEFLARRYDGYSEAYALHQDFAAALHFSAKAQEAAAHCGRRLAGVMGFNRIRIYLLKGDPELALEAAPHFSQTTPLNEAIEYGLLSAVHHALGNAGQASHWRDKGQEVIDRYGLQRAVTNHTAWGMAFPSR